jgi:RNA polymerase sigma-70 factor (ECF subfamily)
MIMTEPARRKPQRAEEQVEAPASPPQIDEMELVKRARHVDLESYDELVKRYQERIYATIYHMTSNHEDANDLAQEAFIKAFHALKSFKGGSSFYT